MADRWSSPSGSRFRLWPSGSDSYDHAEFASNWDTLDAIIGVPTGGGWPSTEGIGGGIYYEIQKAKEAAIPVGMALPWFRANEDMEIPAGYVVCDGQTVAAADHTIPNVASDYTVPDLRNRFVIGANNSTAIGTSGVEATNTLVNSATGAPGPQGTGGENTTTLTKAQMAAHRHTGSTTGWSPAQETWYNDNDGKHPAAGNFESTKWDDGHSIGTGQGGYISGQHKHYVTLAEDGKGKPHENRPLYVGLIWIIKVKNVL